MGVKLQILEMLRQGTITVDEAGPLLEVAATLLQSVKHDLGKPGTDPIVVDIDDANERVQIYIG